MGPGGHRTVADGGPVAEGGAVDVGGEGHRRIDRRLLALVHPIREGLEAGRVGNGDFVALDRTGRLRRISAHIRYLIGLLYGQAGSLDGDRRGFVRHRRRTGTVDRGRDVVAVAVAVHRLVSVERPDHRFEHGACRTVAGETVVHVIAVARQSVTVVQAGGAEVLEHRARRDDTVEAAGLHGRLAMGGDDRPHLGGIVEGLGHILGLGQVMIGLGKDIIELGGSAIGGLGGLHLLHKALRGRFLCSGPAPGELPPGMLLDGDDVIFPAGRGNGQALAADIRPAGLAGIADIAVVVGGTGPAVVILRDGPPAIVHVDHLDIVQAGGGKDAGQVLDGVLGEAVADEQDTEGSRDIQARVRSDRRVAGGDVDLHAGVRRLAGGPVLAEVLDLVALGIEVIDGVAAAVGANLAGGLAALPGGRLGHITEEDAAVLAVGNNFTVVLVVGIFPGIRQGNDAAYATGGGRNEVAVILAARDGRAVVGETDDVPEAGTVVFGHGIELVAAVLAVHQVGAGVGGAEDAGGTPGLGGHFAMVAAVRDDVALGVAGGCIGKADNAGDVEAGRAGIQVGRILGRDGTPVVDAVHDAAFVLGIEAADQGHMEIACGTAIICHWSITCYIPDGRVIDHTGDQAGAHRDRSGHRQRAVFIDDEVLDDGARAQVAEEAEVPARLRFGAGQLQVLDVVGVAVKLAGKRMSVLHHGVIAVPRGGHMAHRLEIGHAGKVEVGEQVHPSFRIFPSLRGFPGIDGAGEGHEIRGAGDTLGRRGRLFDGHLAGTAFVFESYIARPRPAGILGHGQGDSAVAIAGRGGNGHPSGRLCGPGYIGADGEGNHFTAGRGLELGGGLAECVCHCEFSPNGHGIRFRRLASEKGQCSGGSHRKEGEKPVHIVLFC